MDGCLAKSHDRGVFICSHTHLVRYGLALIHILLGFESYCPTGELTCTMLVYPPPPPCLPLPPTIFDNGMQCYRWPYGAEFATPCHTTFLSHGVMVIHGVLTAVVLW